MSSSSHSDDSSSPSASKADLLSRIHSPSGTHRVHYKPNSDWDYTLTVSGHNKAVDVDLVLPHFRAKNQPADHRLNIYLANYLGPIKAKICRSVSRTKFYCEIRGGQSDIIVYIPSDFKGQLRYKAKRAHFSPIVAEQILPHCRSINKVLPDTADDDHIVVSTHGNVTFRMWDILSGAAEPTAPEGLKKLFGYPRRSPSPNSDSEWDFLLDG
ncbi:hypothetical protein DL96DRAFT_1578792 [Flagelloscypha sp. PMI_526]|nr:hypothetical protein DL96DRAFT_1578792 [Flagelloscypha sp. PMI_526]